MLDLRLLESFCAVIDSGSVYRAAIQLGFAQSTFTQRLQSLERHVGYELFVREGKRLTPTETGMKLYQEAKALLRQADALDGRFSNADSNMLSSITFGCSEPTLVRMIPALNQFKRMFPKIRLQMVGGTSAALSHMVLDGRLTFSLCLAASYDGRLCFTPLYDEAFGLLIPANHPLACKPRLSLDDLKDENLIFSDPTCSYRALFQRAIDASGSPIRPHYEITSLMGRISAVQQSLGIAVLPAFSVDPAPAGTVFRMVEEVVGAVTLGLLMRADMGDPSMPVKALLDAVRANAVQLRRPLKRMKITA